MDKEKVAVLKQFIQSYKAANDKEAFIEMWESVLDNSEDVPLTLSDAYDEAYGGALIQLYAEE
jgi:hypothetical protein